MNCNNLAAKKADHFVIITSHDLQGIANQPVSLRRLIPLSITEQIVAESANPTITPNPRRRLNSFFFKQF
ncbi:MAG TPA: hypothetical protein VGF82_20330 [Terracidiphilus sp.]|jgi:hypothetical protein